MNYSDKLLNCELTFDKYSIDSKYGVIMTSTETPLMNRYAYVINHNRGDILEIGFGMGIFANIINYIGYKSHTIVEMHPQVLEKLYDWSKNKDNIYIIEGNWIDNIDNIIIKKYDGIFFDTHMDDNRSKFRKLVVDRCVKDNGVFGYFNIDENLDPFGYNDNLINEKITIPKSECKMKYEEGTMMTSWVKYPIK